MVHKLTFALLGLIFFVSSCRSLKEPDYLGIESFRLAKLGFPDSKLLVRLAYYNPNHFGVTVKQTECKVYVDSIFLGTFSLDSVIHVHDRENFYLPFTGQVTTTSLLQNGITAVSGKEMNIRIEGTTRVGKAGIFANYPIHYEGRQVLNTY